MGKYDLGLSIVKSCSAWVKASGKSNILQTKPQVFTKNTVFAYKPKYDRAVDSIYQTLVEDGLNSQEAQKLAKSIVRENMVTWGRPLEYKNFKRRSSDPKLLELPNGGFGEDASTYAMNITNKARAIHLAKCNPKIAERMKTHPEAFKLSQEEAISKTILDRAFAKVPPNAVETLEYRGAALPKDHPAYKNLLNLKKGDIYTEPGYTWTSPNQDYAFGRYADSTGGFKPQASIQYHILLPKGSKMLCVDRFNPETLLRYNSQFKVHNIEKSDNGNIQLFLEYLQT